MKLTRITAMAALACMTAVSMAQNSGVELLKKMEQKFQNVKSVQGSFTQSKKDPTFDRTVSIPASFQILKPNYFKAEYQEGPGKPPSVQLISGDTFYNYVPQLKQVNTYKFRNQSNVRDLNYLLLGFGAKADEVTKVYKVAASGANGVRLTPKNASEASFNYIIMEVDPASLYPTRFTMQQTDKTDLSVQINPSSLQINPALTAKDFQPNFPRDAQRVPLD